MNNKKNKYTLLPFENKKASENFFLGLGNAVIEDDPIYKEIEEGLAEQKRLEEMRNRYLEKEAV
ncbi:MAG: hypothetical protein AB7D47_12005 [Desulfovibrio sp.]